MKLTCKHLWKVPVYCMAASWFTFNVTAYIGGHFFTVTTVEADGILLSTDPVRVAIFNGALFLAVLLMGGLWAFRAMTRREIAASAAVACAVYLLIVLAQLWLPGFPLALSIMLAYIQNWPATASSFLIKLTGTPPVSVILSSFAPLLFIPFGKKESK